MLRASLRSVHLLIFALFFSNAVSQVATTVVSVTSTKTVHVTATDYAGACDNFVGACVVYGTNDAAPYTTTIYVSRSATTASLTTSTSTIIRTTTASNRGACESYVGACVVYATDAGGSASSTVYYTASTRPGNAQGYIGPKKPDTGEGLIGRAANKRDGSWTIFLCAIGATTALVLCL